METIILSTTEEDLKRAGELLREGKLVAFPTETVYGLGANALDEKACKNVYLAKGRPTDNPMIVHISHVKDIESLTNDMTNDMKILMDKFWPGPLTMIVNAKDVIPKVTTGGLSTVAIRMPSSEVARKVISYSGCPIAAPSANLSGKPSPTKASHVIDDMSNRIDAIIDGPECEVGIESTVIDMTVNPPVILRPGIITKEEISKVLGKDVTFDPNLLKKPEKDFKPKSPGMRYKHYAPNGKMILFKGDKDKVRARILEEEKKAKKDGIKVRSIFFSDDINAAHDIFKLLRSCDKEEVELILVEGRLEEGVGFSVMNRMLRSAGYNIIEVK